MDKELYTNLCTYRKDLYYQASTTITLCNYMLKHGQDRQMSAKFYGEKMKAQQIKQFLEVEDNRFWEHIAEACKEYKITHTEMEIDSFVMNKLDAYIEYCVVTMNDEKKAEIRANLLNSI